MTTGSHGFDGVERRGLMFVLSSPSGAGKTTLSRLIACLEAGEHPDHPALECAVESQSGSLIFRGAHGATRFQVRQFLSLFFT